MYLCEAWIHRSSRIKGEDYLNRTTWRRWSIQFGLLSSRWSSPFCVILLARGLWLWFFTIYSVLGWSWAFPSSRCSTSSSALGRWSSLGRGGHCIIILFSEVLDWVLLIVQWYKLFYTNLALFSRYNAIIINVQVEYNGWLISIHWCKTINIIVL